MILLLQDGQRKITCPNGKEADVRNCILILTTNLGSKDAEKTIRFGSDLERVYEDDLKNTLLLNLGTGLMLQLHLLNIQRNNDENCRQVSCQH